MSGDVQPRKRKDKKRKKDDLGVEEPRGTAAALGEGDIFIHSYHDHGTGGHWCAKIIFFALLAVLISLIGLIILENRGLSELEANAVESRYSGVLEGWIENAPDDDHHDEHTLELKHHEDLEDDEQHKDDGDEEEDHEHSEELDQDDEEDHENSEELDQDDEEEDHGEEKSEELDQEVEDNDETSQQDDDEETNQQDDDDDDDVSQQDDEENEEVDEQDYGKYLFDAEDDEENEDINNNVEHEYLSSYQNDEANEAYADDDDDDKYKIEDGDNDDEPNDDNENFIENKDDDEHDEDNDDDDDEQTSEEVEKLENEASDEEPISTELPALPEQEDDDDDGNDAEKQDDEEDSIDDEPKNVDDNDVDDDIGDDDDDDFLEQLEDDDGPPVEKITAPSGQPFDEIEEVVSSEKPPSTLDEEEEYEKQQEDLRREEEQKSSQNDTEDENEEETAEVESPSVVDRRMTLLLDEPPVQEIIKKTSLESSKPIPQDVLKRTPLIIKSAPTPKASVDVEEEDEDVTPPKAVDKELYSDDDISEEDDENVIAPTKVAPKQATAPTKETTVQPTKTLEPDPEEEDIGEEIEIIDEEQLEEEEEEDDEDEEDISDVDDAELLTRLEEKYGRLPEPERPGARHKDGGNNMEDYWPSEPSDPLWHEQLEEAERDLLRGRPESALSAASAAELKSSARARWIIAQSLDKMAEARRDNKLLTQAINAYLEVLKMNENMPDKKLLEVAARALDRIQFRGTYLNAEPVYRLLIRRFPNQVHYRNNLTVSFLMAGRADLAEAVLKETLAIWPKDRVALAHLGFVLKTEHNKLEEAVELFKTALEGDSGPACEPRFYFHYGDALLLLRRFAEAHEVHKRGAAHGHLLSPEQRSLYNVDRLKSRPWWDVEKQTPYGNLARALEKSWREILKEGEAAKALYEKEKEGLRERGEWSQLDLFVRGQEIPGRCKQAPVTCSIVKSEVSATRCRRGQIKFSSMEPGTHVRPHVGPTNCRLRMHLGLKNTKDTYIRVHKEIRQWQEGKVLLFDDSFEHEVWHNGTGTRLVLIVDVWHPDLTANERRQLPAI